MRSKTLLTTALLLLAWAGTGGADPTGDVSGTYSLTGKIGWHGPTFDTTLTLTRQADKSTYDVKRRHVVRGSKATFERAGKGTVEAVQLRPEAPEGDWRVKVRLKVVFPPVKGAAEALEEALGGVEVARRELTGTYTILEPGGVAGWVQVGKAEGGVQQVNESGDRAPAEDATTPVVGPDAPKLLRPARGVYLAGTELPIRTETAGDMVEVLSGPGQVQGQYVVLLGQGEVRVRARRGEKVGATVSLEAVAPQVTRITILDRIEMTDAPPPHYERTLGRGQARRQPAAILQGTPLRLEVTLSAAANLTRSAVVRLTGSDGDTLRLSDDVELKRLKAGQTIVLESDYDLNEAVAVNTLELSWGLEAEREAWLGSTPLRVYTTYGKPVLNPIPRYAPARKGYPVNTKLHLELACTWANGASKNTGSGADSIGEQIDNQFRHLVHPKDYGEQGQFAPFLPHYAKGLDPPSNYGKLPGTVSQGRRDVSRIYYPSVGKEDWTPYRNNFGWWVLETTGIAGGRCNQQASCISDILGTLGIRAKVYYIERTAKGRKTGRAMRRHYRSNISGALWNFHGMCEATLSDGTGWLYDGSGSWPPNRTNGKTASLMKVPGKYVKYWHLWRYDDDKGNNWFAPLEDWPETWHGVPLQEGEAPLDPQAKDGTYAFKLGSGDLPDPDSETPGATKRREFYIVNVGGEMVTKLDEGKPEAATYQSSIHGSIANWTKH